MAKVSRRECDLASKMATRLIRARSITANPRIAARTMSTTVRNRPCPAQHSHQHTRSPPRIWQRHHSIRMATRRMSITRTPIISSSNNPTLGVTTTTRTAAVPSPGQIKAWDTAEGSSSISISSSGSRMDRTGTNGTREIGGTSSRACTHDRQRKVSVVVVAVMKTCGERIATLAASLLPL